MVYINILQHKTETWSNMYDTSAALLTPLRFSLYIKTKNPFFVIEVVKQFSCVLSCFKLWDSQETDKKKKNSPKSKSK